jgi:two-component system chemotaxis response regulator CheB
MPQAALRQVRADYVLPAAAIPEVLARVVGKPVAERGVEPMDEIERMMAQVMQEDITAQAHDSKSRQLTIYSCPDCGGSLWQASADMALDFSCHVGHRWSADAMLQRKSEEVESRLWACVRTLREKETLTRQLAARVQADGHADLATQIKALAQGDEAYIATLQQMLSAVSRNPMLQMAEVSELLETLESDEPPSIGKPVIPL